MKEKITDYYYAVRMARMYGVSFPWFLPRIRCLKIIQNPKPYNKGDKIEISGDDRDEYNGSYVVTEVDVPNYNLKHEE